MVVTSPNTFFFMLLTCSQRRGVGQEENVRMTRITVAWSLKRVTTPIVGMTLMGRIVCASVVGHQWRLETTAIQSTNQVMVLGIHKCNCEISPS